MKASLAKWLSVRLWTKWLWVPVQLQSLIEINVRILSKRLTFITIQTIAIIQSVFFWQGNGNFRKLINKKHLLGMFSGWQQENLSFLFDIKHYGLFFSICTDKYFLQLRQWMLMVPSLLNNFCWGCLNGWKRAISKESGVILLVVFCLSSRFFSSFWRLQALLQSGKNI